MAVVSKALAPTRPAPCLHGAFGEPSRQEDGLSVFMSTRARLFGIACRMLRNAAEAEEVVQEVWVRWQMTDRSIVRDPAAFLVTTTTRVALNVMQSARWRRETFLFPTLAEPADGGRDASTLAEHHEALEEAVRMVLEHLSTTEQVAYLLREAFDCPYRQIAGVLQLEEAHTRQLVTRARHRIMLAGRSSHTRHGQASRVDLVIRSVRRGDPAGITRLLAATDGRRASRIVAA